MPANIETIAFNQAEVPWHGLGTAVDPNISIEEWLTAAGLDWTVEKMQVFRRTSKDDGKAKAMPQYRVLVRSTDGQEYGIVSDRYNPVQNAEVLSFYRDYTKAGDMTIETSGALGDGRIIWALAKVNHGSDFTLPGGDKVKAYLLLANSHDGSISYQAKFTSVRVVCQNTLSMAFSEKGGNLFKVRHSSKKDRVRAIEEDAKKMLQAGRKTMANFREKAEKLADSKVDFNGQVVRQYLLQLTGGKLLDDVVTVSEAEKVQSTEGILDAVISNTTASRLPRAITEDDLNRAGKAILDDIISSPGSNLPSAHNTWWGVLNGVTHYVDHTAPVRGVNSQTQATDNRLSSAWFGRNGTMKEKALELCLQYAERKVA